MSSIILASQNIEDFLIPSIREFTKETDYHSERCQVDVTVTLNHWEFEYLKNSTLDDFNFIRDSLDKLPVTNDNTRHCILALDEAGEPQAQAAVSGDAATQVWTYLKGYGYSDSVAAGIIGNMMRECGGDTLDLDWDIVGHFNGDEFYGLCQWCLEYTPSGFKGASIQKQPCGSVHLRYQI